MSVYTQKDAAYGRRNLCMLYGKCPVMFTDNMRSGVEVPGFPLLFFEPIFTIHIYRARLLTGKGFQRPRLLFFLWGNGGIVKDAKAEGLTGVFTENYVNRAIVSAATRNIAGVSTIWDALQKSTVRGVEVPRFPLFFFQIQMRFFIMADVQKEYGYTAQANSYIEALAKIRIPGEANQCLLVIQRKTWGWNKKWDDISLSQFVKATGICKPHVCRAISILIDMNMICVTKKGNGVSEYAIQKDFEKWKPLPKKVTLPKKVIEITKKGNGETDGKIGNSAYNSAKTAKKPHIEPLPKKVHTKDTSIKPSITKEKDSRKENWLKMLDKYLGEGLSVFEKKDLPKIKEKLDKPTYERLLSILKEREEEKEK
jgi:phage replication O-like protein O